MIISQVNHTYTSIQNKFNELKQYQKVYIQEILNEMFNVNDINAFGYLNKPTNCSKCNFTKMIGHGGNRFKCKCCGSTQTITKDTVLYILRNKDKWVDFVYLMLSEETPLSLNSIIERIPMTIKIAHDWRQRFLTSMINIHSKFFSV